MSVPAVGNSLAAAQTATAGTTSVPVANSALEPAWVRNGSASTQRAYATALEFEQMLVEQLSQSLAKAGGLGGESSEGGESSGEEGSEAGASSLGPLSAMLPQALTDGVMRGGGLGLAAQLTRSMQAGESHTVSAAVTGGTTAATGGTTSAPAAEGTRATTPAAQGTTSATTGGTAIAGGTMAPGGTAASEGVA